MPAIVTSSIPAPALTVIFPVIVSPLPSSTLLSAAVALPSVSSTIITGAPSSCPLMVMIILATSLSPSASLKVYSKFSTSQSLGSVEALSP